MRKVLYLQWACFGEEYICDSLVRAGFEIEKYPIPYGKEEMRDNEPFVRRLTEKLGGGYEFAFSFNFFPVAADACHTAGLPYLSWTYDSPFMLLYSRRVLHPTNYAFCFDKATVEELQKRGADTVHYLPMAAPVAYYDSLHSSAGERKRYGSDISFVGALYTEEQRDLAQKYLGQLGDEVRDYFDKLIELQLQSYAMPVLEKLINGDVLALLQQVCPIPHGEDDLQTESWTYANYFLARSATGRERSRLLAGLDQRLGAGDFGSLSGCSLKLYTFDATPSLLHVQNMGTVEYCREMPHVFKNSRINLNISLKSIYTGIPLRAFDIMGCGGFLLSDFQGDFGGLFVPEEDYVFYTTPEDFYAKAAYYLEHEDRRSAIAQNGYEKVKEAHTYDHRLAKMLAFL